PAVGTHWYGSWIFFEYIDEHLGGSGMIENIFVEGINTNSENGDYSHQAIDDALSTIGSSFQEALNGMAIANVVMSSNPGNDTEMYTYEEVENFPIDGPAIYRTINFSDEEEFEFVQSTSLNQYASQYIQIDTDIPVLITLDTLNEPLSDFGLHCVVKYTDDNYEIITGNSLSIYNALDNAEEIYAVVVSQDENSEDFNYILKIEATNTPPEVFSIISPELNAKLDTLFPRFE
ncbi:uncharacterized protein METZ01_LOCUS504313, partial [marine metagenome]